MLEQVAKAPAEIARVPRNPARTVRLGGGALCCTSVGGSPFVSDRERGRREGTLADHVEIVSWRRRRTCSPAARVRRLRGLGAVRGEPAPRHEYSWHALVGQAVRRYGDSGPQARDSVELAAIACGGRERIEREPAILGIVNPNSPLVWDLLMVDAPGRGRRRNQPVR